MPYLAPVKQIMVQNLAIGERIKEERERLGYSQTAFAALADSSKRTQIGWEGERSFPDASVLFEWAKVGADIGYMVTGKKSGADEQPTRTERETALLNNYRSMDERGKEIVDAAASAAAQSTKIRK